MSRYAKGAQLERKVKAELEAMGFYVVRSAGSKGAADLIVFSRQGLLLLQLKRTKQKLGKRALRGIIKAAAEKFEELPLPPDTKCEVWVWSDYHGWVAQEIVREVDNNAAQTGPSYEIHA